MGFWTKAVTLEELNRQWIPPLATKWNAAFTQIGDGELTASFEVTPSACQPFGYLHGGVSVYMGESLGSIAANLCIAEDQQAFGMDITASHVRPVKMGGVLTITARNKHRGKTTQLWGIEVQDQQQRLVADMVFRVAVVS